MKQISNFAWAIPTLLVWTCLYLCSQCAIQAEDADGPYSMPRGIPAPDWDGFDPVNATPPERPASWPAVAAIGFYYVASNHSSATDTDNPFGTPERPRKSVPLELPPGSYVEVTHCETRIGLVGVKGTPELPIWIVGSGEAKVQPRETKSAVGFVDSEYILVDGLYLDGTGTPTNQGSTAWAVSSSCNHIAIRNCKIRNQPAPPYNPERFSSGGAGAWYSGLSSIVPREGPVSDIVVFGCDYTGNSGGQTLDYESGRHCLIASGRTDGGHVAENVWILNNIMHDNPEDGIQLGETSNRADRSLCRNFFIGGNTITNNGENAIDFKSCERVIVSQNLMSGYRRTSYRSGSVSGSDGSACVLNNDGGGPFETWWLFNTIADSRVAWRNQSEGGNHYFIGNLVTDLKISPSDGEPTSSGKSSGVGYWQNSGANPYLVNNTFHSVHGGIYFFNVGHSAIQGNVIHDIVDHTAGWAITVNNNDSLKMAGNLSSDPDGAIRDGAKGQTDLVNVNPKFVETSFDEDSDFLLAADSPMLDIAVSMVEYETAYLATWGKNIELDFDRTLDGPGANVGSAPSNRGIGAPRTFQGELLR